MNKGFSDLIGWWKIKGERESDPFMRFFFFYVCFDAWITAESGKDSDMEKFKWFLHSDNCLKKVRLDFWGSAETQSWLNSLKQLSPVEDMRPNHRGEYTNLNDINNLEEVVKYIYQIRCNLFHGAKDPMNDRDANLVENSGLLLKKWIMWAHLKCNT